MSSTDFTIYTHGIGALSYRLYGLISSGWRFSTFLFLLVLLLRSSILNHFNSVGYHINAHGYCYSKLDGADYMRYDNHWWFYFSECEYNLDAPSIVSQDVFLFLLPPKEVMFLVALVCLFVCLSVCGQHYSKNYERIGVKFYGGVMGSTRTD